MRRSTLLALPAVLALLAAPAPASASGGGGKKAEAPPSPYIQIPIITATIQLASGKRGVLAVETGVFVDDPALRARAEASAPRLRAAYFQILQTYTRGLVPGAPPNPDFLGAELQRETDKVLGRPGAKVLFSTILMN